MYSDNPKIQAILELGQPKGNYKNWPDYIDQFGFTADDVPSLVALYGDEEINSLDSSRPEVWAPLHAWRVLGQLRSEQAIAPVIAGFDTLFNDDCALSELGKVLGLIGPKAIDPLSRYLDQPDKNEFSYAMAVDALCEIAKAHPECRPQVIEIYQQYMAAPLETARALNGLLVCQLLELNATETIDDIRRLFARGCVDASCAGDLEEVEIELGFRTERSTPKPHFAKQEMFERSLLHSQDEGNDGYDIIEHWLMEHGGDDSILSVSELDGYFAAIACSPETIMPSIWMPEIWGGQAFTPDWRSKKDVDQFTREVFDLYNTVIGDLRQSDYAPIFMENSFAPDAPLVVDDWCEGFMRGAALWGEMSIEDMRHVEKCLYPIRYFCTDEGFQHLETMTDPEVIDLQQSIAPAVEKLYRHFCMPAPSASATFVHATPKVGRNEPCPCGSGKKYKKCCGLN